MTKERLLELKAEIARLQDSLQTCSKREYS